MRKHHFIFCGLLSLGILFFSGCKNKTNKDGAGEQDILTGKLPVLVDETVYPILQECADVFESSYPNSSIAIMARPEIKAVNALLADSASVIILTRKLYEGENRYFKDRGIEPKIYQVGSDAVIFINNVASSDTIMSQSTVKSLLNGKVAGKKLVFDNANSSTLRYLNDFFKIEKTNANAIAALADNAAVIDYVSRTPDAIGVIGFNWFLKSVEKNAKVLDKIRTLSIESRSPAGKTLGYYKPSQSSVADSLYPFVRRVYILNYQPNMGLGLGFSAFLTGDRGQRILLKGGLVPATVPGREIIVREESYIK